MDNRSSFLIQNKIVTIEQIKEVTEYLRKILDHYDGLIKQELQELQQLQANNNTSLYETHYKYHAYVNPSLEYYVEFTDGRKVNTKDDYVFYDALKEPQYIFKIEIRLYISYEDNEMDETTHHELSISLSFTEFVIYFSTFNKNMNEEHYNSCSYISGLLNGGEDRFSGIIKKRFWVKNLFGLAAGSILTLIAFIVLLLMKNESSDTINMFFNNPIMLVLAGWLIAFAFGSTLIGSIVNGLYSALEDGLENAYRGGTYTEHYEDNYRMFNEVLIGKNYNNLEKRKTIEKLYSVSKKVVLIRLLISLIILVVLSLI